MKKIQNLEFLLPDLYLRYLNGFKIIKKIQKNKPCRILDVGGRLGIMGDLIKKEKLPYFLTFVDSLPDDESKNTICDKYIQQDFLSFTTNKKFDYLVTFDVLEHVHKKDAFINNCLSLCNKLIIAAPFKSDATNAAENIIDEFFFRYRSFHHPWLMEHFEQVLPEIRWLEGIFNSRKIKFEILNSNNIENWINFMLPNQLSNLYTVDDIRKLNKINQYYNQNYKDLGDGIYPSYRKIFIVLPGSTDFGYEEISSQKTKPDIQKKIIFTDMVTDFLTHNIKREINNYTILLNQITSSKFYKFWQLYRNLKKLLSK